MTGRVQVLSALTPLLLQDTGRHGYAAIGVPASGAFDAAAAALAQRLVGNPEQEAALEITLGGVLVRTDTTVTAVLTGADCPVRAGTVAVAPNEVFSWPTGTTLTIGTARSGLRSYLAVRGGFAVPQVLGSRSTDILSGLGPAPLNAGDAIPLAGRRTPPPLLDHAPVQPRRSGLLRILPGPRDEWFTPQALRVLQDAQFRVSLDSNRIGVRLQGPPLGRRIRDELPSEPLQRGALQVPPSGQPIVMGPDHPTTGGYPVIATVVAADWDLLAQLRPGDKVRFELANRGTGLA